MVKQKARYYLVQVIPAKEFFDLKANHIFKELLKLISEMHGDVGFSAVKGSVNVKVAELDIFLIKIETSVEKYVSSTLPFFSSIDGNRIVCRTIFIGRSIRSCEKSLLKLRRQELYTSYKNANEGTQKNMILEEIHSVSGKIPKSIL